MRDSPALRAVETSVHGAGLPYGYAITVWSTGAALVGEHGKATPGLIFLFAGGAVAAYGTLRAASWKTQREAERPLTKSTHPIRAGLVHMCAIALAIAAALLLARVAADVSWFLAPFAATLVYLAGSSAEVALVEQEEEG